MGGLMQCRPQMNPLSSTHALNKASLDPELASAAQITQAAAAAAVTASTSVAWRLLGEASQKQPILDPDTQFYLTVLLCIAAANSAFTFVRAFSFAYGGLVAARKLHEQLLSAVISAPASFFQTTLPGRHISACTISFGLACVQCEPMLLLSTGP